MRANCEKTLTAFLAGKSAKPADSIWTDGNKIWSYRTLIAERHEGKVYLNMTRYSNTTTVHQNALRARMPDAVIIDNFPRGCDYLFWRGEMRANITVIN